MIEISRFLQEMVCSEKYIILYLDGDSDISSFPVRKFYCLKKRRIDVSFDSILTSEEKENRDEEVDCFHSKIE